MCTFNIALDDEIVSNARNSFGSESSMKAWMEEQITVLLRKCTTSKKTEDTNPFAELDVNWGGSRDANEIAEELHSMRSDSRTVEPW